MSRGLATRRSRLELCTAATALGYSVTTTHGGHMRCAHPCGALVITGSKFRNNRSYENAIARLRRELAQRGD